MTEVPLPQTDNSVQSLALALSKAAFSVVPGAGNLINEFIDKTNQRLIETSHRIFLEEVASGRADLSEHEKEEFIPIGYRYYRAAQEGTVNRNLHLLAKLIRKQIDDEELSYEKYVTMDNAIRDLSLEEMICLAEMCSALNNATTTESENNQPKRLSPFFDGNSSHPCFTLLAAKGWVFPYIQLAEGRLVTMKYTPTQLFISAREIISQIHLDLPAKATTS